MQNWKQLVLMMQGILINWLVLKKMWEYVFNITFHWLQYYFFHQSHAAIFIAYLKNYYSFACAIDL